MKALTILQPYAWAVMQFEGKSIENRSWNTDYRGLFWVHAAKQPWNSEAELAAGWMEHTFGLIVPPPEELQFGAILGTVKLIDVTRHADLWTEWALPGSYHWMLRYPDPLPQAIPDVVGHQRWWEYEREAR